MPTVPVQIIQAGASGSARYGIVSGRIEGDLKAGIELTAEACHGVAIGIEPGVLASAGARGQALFIGASAEGALTAQAGVKVILRVEPNPFDALGLTLEAGAYAFAAAAGRLGVYLTPEYFSRFIQDHLDELPADLFLIFLEEVRAEVGVWGKIAAAAAIEGHVNVVLNLDGEDSGFEISAGFNAGWGAGTGWDFYCAAGFTDLRRAVKRSCLRLNLEIAREIRKQPTPAALTLAGAFDFAFPLLVMTAYDLGVVAHRKQALLDEHDVAAVLQANFTESLQRFTADTMAECAVKWLVGEFRKLYVTLAGRTLSDADVTRLEERSDDLVALLDAGELDVDKLNRALAAAVDIADTLDDGELTRISRPLTTFWLAGMLGLRARLLLDTVEGDVSGGSTLVGSTGGSLSMSLLPDPPQLVLDEIHATLGRQVLSVDIGIAADYLVEIGVAPLLATYSPEFEDFRQKLESAFGLSAGDVVEDIVRSIAGLGTLSDLNSYTAFKQLVQEELLRDAVQDQLLPLVRQRASDDGNTTLVDYVDEVVEPCVAVFAEFLFARLDAVMLSDLATFDADDRHDLGEEITAGCGVVIYQVLARNLVFFDRVVTDFMLDHTQRGTRDLRVLLEDPDHPFVQACRQVLEANLPGSPDLSGRTEALRVLLLDLTVALEQMSGPTIWSATRRARMHTLKRDVLLSMSGDFGDRSRNAIEALVEHVLDCTHVPNRAQSEQLAMLLLQIQAESFAVLTGRIVPALSDFYLAITLEDLTALRRQLNIWIQELRAAAQQAIAAYAQLAEYIRTEITEVLDGLEALADDLRADLDAHLRSGWAARAKAAIRVRGEEIVTATIADPTARGAALLVFATTEWLIIGPIIDLATAALSTVVAPLVSMLDDFVESSTDAVREFLDWQADVEAELLEDLELMIVVPAAEAAALILDALFPTYIENMIRDYLELRTEQKELEREQLDAQHELALLEAERDAAVTRHERHGHQPDLVLTIAIPDADRSRVYPASLHLSVFAAGLTDEILADPRSRRIQFRLNAQPLTDANGEWQALPDGGHVWTWQSPDGMDFAAGLNIFEASWIRGADKTQVERISVQFLVDADAFYPEQDFRVSIDADPLGRDVDLESVLIEWFGDAPLTLDGWKLRDLAAHRYTMPDGLTLVPGQRLRVFTGGDPRRDSTGNTDSEKVVHMGRRAAIWNNTGDVIELVDDHGVSAVMKAYGDARRGGG